MAGEHKLQVPSREQPNSAPVTIIEMIVLTAAMAITFRLQNRLDYLNVFGTSNALWFDVVQRSIFALSVGVPLAAAWRFIKQRQLVGKFLIHPGHWILFVSLTLSLALLIPLLMEWHHAVMFSAVTREWYGFTGMHAIAMVLAAPIACSIIGYASSRVSPNWQLPALLLAGVLALISTQSLLTLGYRVLRVYPSSNAIRIVELCVFATSVVTALVFAIAIKRDISKREKRDAWHWIGLLTGVAAILVSPSLTLLRRYFQFIW